MRQHNVVNNQQGLIAIIVSMILMIILSLIVLGFATNTRREQRQSLDRQLNSRAFYAAESGINDAREYIKDQLALGAQIKKFDKCGSAGGLDSFSSTPGYNNIIEGGSSYPCLLIDPTPPTITYGSLSKDDSVAFPVKSATITPITELTVSWQQDNKEAPRSYGGCPSVGTFPKESDWDVSVCSAGMLRIDLTPVTNLSRAALIDNTKSFLLQPSGGGTSAISFGVINKGQVIGVNCTVNITPTTAAPKDCNVVISGLTDPEGYYMRVRPIYRNASMQFSGSVGSTFEGVQAVVDSTGKSSDVLKRLQVRLSINTLESDNNTSFNYAIQSLDSICKKYSVIPAPTSKVSSLNPDPSCAAPGP